MATLGHEFTETVVLQRKPFVRAPVFAAKCLNDSESTTPAWYHMHCIHAPFFKPNANKIQPKATSHLETSKPYSSKHLHSTLILTSMKCAGSRHVQMKFSTCMAQKSLRQRTPKWRSPPEKYISAGCKIPPFVVFKLQTLPNQALMTVYSPNQVLVSSCWIMLYQQ